MLKYNCPVCKQSVMILREPRLELYEEPFYGHRVAYIAKFAQFPASEQDEAAKQIAANLRAYELDYDAKIELGFRGTAWIQCPYKRRRVTRICNPI